jgi:hypothetical protein
MENRTWKAGIVAGAFGTIPASAPFTGLSASAVVGPPLTAGYGQGGVLSPHPRSRGSRC